MKLYARTPAGFGLGLTVWPTGQFRESGGKIRSVEVKLPAGCDPVVGYVVEPLPKAPDGSQLLWADVGDLCADDATTLTQVMMRDAIERVRAEATAYMNEGPLGKNWP